MTAKAHTKKKRNIVGEAFMVVGACTHSPSTATERIRNENEINQKCEFVYFFPAIFIYSSIYLSRFSLDVVIQTHLILHQFKQFGLTFESPSMVLKNKNRNTYTHSNIHSHTLTRKTHMIMAIRQLQSFAHHSFSLPKMYSTMW